MQMLGGRDATPLNTPADDRVNQDGDPFGRELHKAPPTNPGDPDIEPPW